MNDEEDHTKTQDDTVKLVKTQCAISIRTQMPILILAFYGEARNDSNLCKPTDD